MMNLSTISRPAPAPHFSLLPASTSSCTNVSCGERTSPFSSSYSSSSCTNLSCGRSPIPPSSSSCQSLICGGRRTVPSSSWTSVRAVPSSCCRNVRKGALLALSSAFLGSGPRGRGGGNSNRETRRSSTVVCGLWDYWGGDLLGFDLDKWSQDVEDYGSIAVYPPPEGGYEGRYATRLKQEGYHFLNLSARGLGDPEAYLSKIHGVRPAHLGKQAIECFYLPPEVDYRLARLPKDSKGLVVWVIEAKVLSKTELQYLALLPALRKKVKVIAECGSWRSYRWKPLREVAGLPLAQTREVAGELKKTVSESKDEEIKPQPKVVV